MRNLLLPFLCCLLLSCGTIQQKIDHKKIATKSCNNLYPISQPEDFVKQAYANLNSDCLFEMSAKDLQASWKIPVLTWQNFEELKNLETIYRQQSDVPYYVLINKDTIKLEASDDFLVKKGSLLIKKIDGLPEPSKVIPTGIVDLNFRDVFERQRKLIERNGGVLPLGGYFKNIAVESHFQAKSKYYWVNKNTMYNIYFDTDLNLGIHFLTFNRNCDKFCSQLVR